MSENISKTPTNNGGVYPEFLSDDYDEINAQYFNELRKSGSYLDPSGWLDTTSNALSLLPFSELEINGFQSYYADYSTNLGNMKESLVDLLGAWDECQYSLDEVTVCQSATAASVLVLDLLRTRGVRTVLFESPCYFASIDQCSSLGMVGKRIPAHIQNGYAVQITSEYIKGASPCAIWITQPRIGLGYNQEIHRIQELVEMLSPEDYLVIDEAVEQMFPSILCSISPQRSPKVLKIRSLLKSCGLNGIRLSFVIHHKKYRPILERALDRYNPSIDYFSLNMASRLAKQPELFRNMLLTSNQQTTQLRKRAEGASEGSLLHVNSLVNGYIGSLSIDFGTKTFSSYQDVRRRFLSQCQQRMVPVILGASMSFALDHRHEHIRLNFFNREHHVLDGIEQLRQAAEAIHHEK